MTEADISRFWSKIQIGKADECWPWIAKSRHQSGYGLFTMASARKGGVKHVASRIACYLGNGPAPDGLPNALHSCDNKPCCNPAHLRWGTQLHNVHDAIQRKRHKNPPPGRPKGWGNPLKGERGTNCKTTEAQIREVWRLHMLGKTQTEITHATGAGRYAVNEATRGRSWRHLQGAPAVEDLKRGGVRRGFNQFSG